MFDGFAPPYTLEQWVNYYPPSHRGVPGLVVSNLYKGTDGRAWSNTSRVQLPKPRPSSNVRSPPSSTTTMALKPITFSVRPASKTTMVGWLIGFYGTAALYRLYSAGECSECENECASRVGGVVPPCTLEQWVNAGLVGSYHLAPSNSG